MVAERPNKQSVADPSDASELLSAAICGFEGVIAMEEAAGSEGELSPSCAEYFVA